MGGKIQLTRHGSSRMAINGVVLVDMENLAKEGDMDSRALAGVVVAPGHPILQLILKGWTFMAPNGKRLRPTDPDQAGAGWSKERRPRPQLQDGVVDGMVGAVDGMGGAVDGVNGAGVGNTTPFIHLQCLRALLLDQVTHPRLLAFLQRLLQVKQIPRKRRVLPLHPPLTIPPTTQLRKSHLPQLLLVQQELHLPPR